VWSTAIQADSADDNDAGETGERSGPLLRSLLLSTRDTN
jgi:hypothetical protein